jgi:hypothetical protein
MNDILVFAGLVVGWIVLNIWVLPWFGIQTCMSGACRVGPVGTVAPRDKVEEAVHVNETARDGKG